MSPLGAYVFDHTAVGDFTPFDVRPATDDYPFFYQFNKQQLAHYALIALGIGTTLVATLFFSRQPPSFQATGHSPEIGAGIDETSWRNLLIVGCAALGASLAGPPLAHRVVVLLG